MKKNIFQRMRMNPLFLILALLLVLSCEQGEEPANKKESDSQLEKHFQFLEETTGYERKDITYDVANDRFLIHDDMYISRQSVEEYLDDPSGRKDQRRYTYIVSSANVANVKYYVQGSVPAAWKTAITQAIAQWNNVTGTRVGMSEVSSSSSANVIVDAQYDNVNNWVARAALPGANGAPGGGLTVNTFHNGMEAGMKLFAMVHEMGHNIGLLHTNQTDGALIPGTPATDANSVMNSFVLPWNGFTYYDQVAVRVLYPESTGGPDRLSPGQQLLRNQSIRSTDGRFTLIMQNDGNLVIYKGAQALWATNTWGKPVTRCVMQNDGNLVLYDNNNAPYWASNTWRYPGGTVIMQNDGNLVIYQGGVARWASGTCCH
jgi:hypothetical protein